MTPNPDRPLAGVAWMLITGLCFVGVTAVVKHVGSDVPASQAAFLRYLLGLVFLLPMIKPLMAACWTRKGVALFGLRGAVHTVGVIMWFYAMTQITVAEVTAMNYMSPVYVTLGAAVFLGERLAARRIMAVGVALVGALIILRPGFRELNSGHFAMLFTAVGFAGSYLIAKRMASEASATVVVAMLSITVTIGLAPFAFAVWVPPTFEQLAWLFLVATFATAGHFSMSMAFAAAPVSVTQPVTFLQLVWAVTLGAVVFGEPVDGWVVAGGALIMASVAFITWREAVLKRRGVTPPAESTRV
ncbi:DMT family transporter [Aliiroseovarius subalbicans]|uniref:DMT family transporter n=1 Tax=Aliiroseovarius subalbicans TaxID=2925840 RepID=UPI001F570D34|nr:DMT family transporter [Aliiroseovarius subalbicans]MCI2400537.1 DMT family transporter [Aliiroseovarius subalbicans]